MQTDRSGLLPHTADCPGVFSGNTARCASCAAGDRKLPGRRRAAEDRKLHGRRRTAGDRQLPGRGVQQETETSLDTGGPQMQRVPLTTDCVTPVICGIFLYAAQLYRKILIDLVTTTQMKLDLSDWWKNLSRCRGRRDRPAVSVVSGETDTVTEKRSSTGTISQSAAEGGTDTVPEHRSLAQDVPHLNGKIVGILHTSNDSLADVVADQGTEILFGTDHFTEELLGLRFKVTPFSFFQTNSYGAEVLYETARKFLTEKNDRCGIVYDLYCGTGTIAQLMAPFADKVIGVEIVEEAVEAARENAKRNGLSNCEFIAGDVLKVLDGIDEKPDTIILDPPRDGIHPKALPRIIAYGVENILYISCKPTSLARDLPAFIGRHRPCAACASISFPGLHRSRPWCYCRVRFTTGNSRKTGGRRSEP